MKKVLLILSTLLVESALKADHIHLSSHTKCVCATKRLEMTKAHLKTMQSELTLLTEDAVDGEPELLSMQLNRLSALKQDIEELKSRSVVMEKSLHALCKTIE